jgi:hypothetical protein
MSHPPRIPLKAAAGGLTLIGSGCMIAHNVMSNIAAEKQQ